MTRLLIQCQGSPGPISFKMSAAAIRTILEQYHHIPRQSVIIVEDDITGHYHISLPLVSWMCVIAESESEP